MLYNYKQKKDRIYPSAPLENIELEQRPEKKLNDVNSFVISINNLEEMIAYFKEKNNKSKKKYKKYKTLTTISKAFDTFVIFATTSSSITFSLRAIRLLAMPMSTATACELSFGKKSSIKDDHKQIQKTQKTI